MKSTTNKIALLFTVSLGFAGALKAQTTTGSPFSEYGLGILRDHNLVQNKSMGGAGIGYFSHLSVNFNNPASYSELRLTNFDVGGDSRSFMEKTATQKQTFNRTNFNHMLFAAPLCKWMDISFGIMPFSTVSYSNSSTDSTAESGKITYENKGEGGLNNAFLGTGFKINTGKNSSIALGGNASYLFGQIYRENRAVYTLANSFNLLDQTYNNSAGFYFNYGLLYRNKINICKKRDSLGKCTDSKSLNFGLGLIYSPSTNIAGTSSNILQTYTGNEGFEDFKDTLSKYINQKGEINIPQKIGVGFSLASDENKWAFTADYQIQQWEKSNLNIDNILTNETTIRAGIQITPNPIATKYWKVVHYRFGVKQDNGYLNINGKPLNDYSVTFGLGLPIRIKQQGTYTLTALNIGFELGKRGTIKDNLLEEYYGNIYFSLTINDKWFRKRKYD